MDNVLAVVQFEGQLKDDKDFNKVGRFVVMREWKKEMHTLDGHQMAYFVMVGAFDNDHQAFNMKQKLAELLNAKA